MAGTSRADSSRADSSQAGTPGPQRREPVWARSRQEPRRPALTREAIVAAAIGIADAEGLAAVSIRRVASELGARTMSLYSHIDSKEDLLHLMYDEATAEVLVDGEMPGDWRAAIALIARQTRAGLLRHPWMVELAGSGRRPRVGPNGLRHGEQSLVALQPLGLDVRTKLRISVAVDDYMLGHVSREIMARGAEGFEPAGGTVDEQPYLDRMARSGEFPNLAPLLLEGFPDIGDTFEQGLEWMLDGIARSCTEPDDDGSPSR